MSGLLGKVSSKDSHGGYGLNSVVANPLSSWNIPRAVRAEKHPLLEKKPDHAHFLGT